MDDVDSQAMYFLILFWTVMIALSIYFQSDIGFMVSGDYTELQNESVFNVFSSLLRILTFNVNSPLMVLAGLVIDFMGFVTIITVYKLIRSG